MIQPTGERVAVEVERVLERDDRGTGILEVPDLGDPRDLVGRVVARGREAPPELRVGDWVQFSRYVGREVHVNGTAVVVLEPDEIRGRRV